MNLERGFHRITLAISLAAAIGGLVVTGYETYETVQFVSATKLFLKCSDDEHKLPSSQWTGSCLEVLQSEPEHLTVLAPLTIWPPQTWRVQMHRASFPLALLPLIVGILTSALLGLVPWDVLYLVRWIVHGFTN